MSPTILKPDISFLFIRSDRMVYHEPARSIPVYANVDVLVLGAGPAGVAAAISAAREGASTLLIEQLATWAALPHPV